MQITAARLNEHGHVDIETLSLSVPDGDVAVELAYASVNPIDLYVIRGTVAPDAALPRTVGSEGSGYLDGQKVVVRGFGLGIARNGSWATHVAVPSGAVVPVPEGVDLPEAAALGVAGATAIRCVEDLAGVGPSDRVLVLGASGGVGSLIASLSASTGARVWGQTTNAAKGGFVKELGAENVIVGDEEAVRLEAGELAPTVVFDPLGGGYTGASVDVLDGGGRHVIFGTSAAPEGVVPLKEVYRKGITILGYGGLRDDAETLRTATARALTALQEGRLHVAIDRIVALSEVNEAVEALSTQNVQGKVVLDLSR